MMFINDRWLCIEWGVGINWLFWLIWVYYSSVCINEVVGRWSLCFKYYIFIKGKELLYFLLYVMDENVCIVKLFVLCF